MATLVAGKTKLAVPVFYQDRKYEAFLRANCSRRRFLKSIRKISELPERIVILQRYELVNDRSSDKKLNFEQGAEILLFDRDQLDLDETLDPVISNGLLSDYDARNALRIDLIQEGVYNSPPTLTLQALADARYYLPNDTYQDLIVQYGPNALPNGRTLTTINTVLRCIGTSLIWTDLLEQEYTEFMQGALKIYEKLIYAHQIVRDERNLQRDLYEPLFTLAGLHKRAGISGGQALKIHAGIHMTSIEAEKRFESGLKPDICDGWLFKHSIDENRYWRLIGPHERKIEGRTGPMLQGLFGDDKFMGIDLLVECNKENKDDIILEAIGSLLCFNKDLMTTPVIFCGICNALQIRFFAVSNATKEDNCQSNKTHRYEEDQNEPIQTADPVKFIVQNLFSTTITNIDSFFQFAMFLWRVKQFRRRQFDKWAATLNQLQPKFDFLSFEKSLKINSYAIATDEVIDDDTSSEQEGLKESFAMLNFVPSKRLRQNIFFELWRGTVNGVEAYLKANSGVNDVANELSIYLYLHDRGFIHMPKLLGSYTSESYDVIIVEKIYGEHIEQLTTKHDVNLYAYKLLKVLQELHALNVVHGDIKPCNIIYDPNNNNDPNDLSNIKLIDFGFAQVINDELCNNEIRGYSIGYSSPELVNTNTITMSDDIFSAGIIIGQLICGVKVQSFSAHEEILRIVQAADVPFGDEFLTQLVMQMLKPRNERPSAGKLVDLFKQFK